MFTGADDDRIAAEFVDHLPAGAARCGGCFRRCVDCDGAHVAVARDYLESGHAAARLAGRVMRGESPARIPFEPFAMTKLIVNVGAARSIGLALPTALVSRADRVIGR